MKKLAWIIGGALALWLLFALTKPDTSHQIVAKIDRKIEAALGEAEDGDADDARALLREIESLSYEYGTVLAAEFTEGHVQHYAGDCRDYGFDVIEKVPRGKFLVAQWRVERILAEGGAPSKTPVAEFKDRAVEWVWIIGKLAASKASACSVAKGMYTGPSDPWMPFLESLRSEPDFKAGALLDEILAREAEQLQRLQPQG